MRGDRVLTNERRTHNILAPPIYFTKTPSPSHSIAREINRVPRLKNIFCNKNTSEMRKIPGDISEIRNTST